MKWGVYVAVLVALFGSSYGASLNLPSYLKKCSRSDPKLNDCALKNGLEAIPTLLKGENSLQIPKLDPLLLEKVRIEEGNGGVRFALTLTKALVHGLKHADVTEVRMDTVNKKVGVKLDVKGTYLQLISPYSIEGQILLLPIKGQGDMNLTLENASAQFLSNYDLVKHADGLEYAKLKDSELKFEIDRAYFHFENLFNGDKALGDNMNTVLNENWQEVYKEVKPAVSDVLKTLILDIISKVTDKVTYDNIFDP